MSAKDSGTFQRHNKSRRSSLLIIENIENSCLLINRKQSEHCGDLGPWKEFTGSRIFVQVIKGKVWPADFQLIFIWKSRFQLIFNRKSRFQLIVSRWSSALLKLDPSSSADLQRTPGKPLTRQLPGKETFWNPLKVLGKMYLQGE